MELIVLVEVGGEHALIMAELQNGYDKKDKKRKARTLKILKMLCVKLSYKNQLAARWVLLPLLMELELFKIIPFCLSKSPASILYIVG